MTKRPRHQNRVVRTKDRPHLCPFPPPPPLMSNLNSDKIRLVSVNPITSTVQLWRRTKPHKAHRLTPERARMLWRVLNGLRWVAIPPTLGQSSSLFFYPFRSACYIYAGLLRPWL